MMYDQTDVTSHCSIREDQSNSYKINFDPPHPGLYNVYVYFNDQEVRGNSVKKFFVPCMCCCFTCDRCSNRCLCSRFLFVVQTSKLFLGLFFVLQKFYLFCLEHNHCEFLCFCLTLLPLQMAHYVLGRNC